MMGNSAVAGTEATTWTIGWSAADSLAFKPIATPAGMVHSAASKRVSSTRRKVAPPPTKMPRSSERVTMAASPAIFTTP